MTTANHREPARSGAAVQIRRLLLLGFLLVVAFCGLGFWLVELQVFRADHLVAEREKNTRLAIHREPRRGDIRDIRGNLLATSVFVKTVCADPVLIGGHQETVARALAPLLQLDPAELARRMQPRLRTNELGLVTTNRYVVLRRKVPVELWQQVQETMKNLELGDGRSAFGDGASGIGRAQHSTPNLQPPTSNSQTPSPLSPPPSPASRAERVFLRNLREKAVFADAHDDQLRIYPNETLAAHVLGYTGMIEREVLGRTIIEQAGAEGIERFFDSSLRGIHGWRLTETDRRRRELVTLRDQDVQPRSGLNVVLSLDAGLQHIVESELAVVMQKHTPVSVSAIAVRPRTGEILAMATLPTFDPNNPGAAPADHRRNRVIVDPHEPGSTFKVAIVAAALDDRVVTLSERIDCEQGVFYYGGRPLRDHDPLGVLSVEGIITRSSNIGAAKIALRMGDARVYQHLWNFGFGQRTGISLPGEEPGILHPTRKWSKISITRIAMGHEIACTPLQMVMAMSALANEGRLMRPMLVDRLEDDQGRIVAQNQPQVIRQAVSEAAARQMVAALKTVVSPEGTGSRAQVEHYLIAGKTGTAQKPGPGGYMPGKYFSSFIGFFPADDPELCLSVVIDEPRQGYYGGQTAGPVFKAIAERAAHYLNIRPEIVGTETFERGTRSAELGMERAAAPPSAFAVPR